ncbi:MAG: transporter [Oscillospiraceae bacterium]|nr:transporter [Oscillospiraceae bacterium]
MTENKANTYLFLHLNLLLYSLGTVFSKLAAGQPFLSYRFILYYGMVILILGIYAIVWQQIIKRLPLTEAFANKAVTVIWGMIWGTLFFSEKITLGKLTGGMFVIAGVVMYARTAGGNADG